MSHYRSVTILSIIMLLLFSLSTVSAQGGSPSCEQLIDDAITALGINCEAMPTNSACYGYAAIETDFFDSAEEPSLSTPGEIADLSLIERIASSQADQRENIWGITALTSETDTTSVDMLVLGDIELINEVNPDGTIEDETGLYMPMQVFTLLMGEDNNSCKEAITGLLIQLDTDQSIGFNGNDADLQLTADICTNIIFRPPTSPQKDSIILVVISGAVTIFPNTPYAITVTTGYQVELPIDEEGLFLVPQNSADYDKIIKTIQIIKNNELNILERMEGLPYPEVLNCPFALPEILRPSGIGQPDVVIVPGTN